MTEEATHCDCDDAGDLLRAHISGIDLPPCPTHRPAPAGEITDGPALNSDELLARLGISTNTL